MPLISVVMPARNAAATLAATLDSLVAQTFKDFELVLVNDASSDDTPHIAESYCSRLSIRLVHHAENQGVAKSINEGLAQSDSIFVARLDADDLARADRLEKQLAFMTAHEAVDVCGSHMEVFSEEEGSQMASFVLAHPTSHAAITTAFVQRCAMAHPSVLARRRLFDEIGAYDPRFDFAEDYELWCRAALLGRQFANIAEPLTRYRRHGGQVSRQKAQLQFSRDIAIKRKYLTGWLDGGAQAHLAEFLSLSTQFASRDVALAVITESTPAMLQLGQRLPDQDEYARIVAGSIRRHLA
jgi:glycosyltransferase involved in cell wall biosynthesis